jgi:hypothetical protein
MRGQIVKFLIDECLSLNLVDVARDRGFTQSSHVVWLGKAGWKDWQLKPSSSMEIGRLSRGIASTFAVRPKTPAPGGSTQTWPSMRDWSV